MVFNVIESERGFSQQLLYSLRDECPELGKLHFQRVRPPLVLTTPPEPVAEALNVVLQRQVQLEVTELDGDGNMVV